MVWLLILFLLCGFIFIVLISYVEGEIYFSRREENDTFWFNVNGLFGIIHIKYQVQIIQFRGLFGGITVHTDLTKGGTTRLNPADKHHITKEKIVDFYANTKLLLNNTVGLTDWAKDLLSHVKCTEFRWETRIGIGDAPETAVTSGLIWSVKSTLLGYAFTFIKLLKKPKVVVEPQYNRMQFSTELSCIAKIRIGHAMIAGLLLLVRILKVKGGLRTWQSILFKA